MSELTDRTSKIKINAAKSGTEWVYDYLKNYSIMQNDAKRRSRGVSSIAQKNEYRKRNLMNNYEEGHFFRVRPFDIISDRNSRFELGLVQPSGENIGELVHLKDIVGNSDKHFMRELEFSLMQDLIRTNSLNRNNEPIDGRYGYANVGLSDYMSLDGRKDIDPTRLPKTLDIGKEYVFPEQSNVFNFSDRKNIHQRYVYNEDEGYFKNVFLPEKNKYRQKYSKESVFWDYRESYGIEETKEENAPDYYINGIEHTINSSTKFYGIGMSDSHYKIYHHFDEPTYQDDYYNETFFGTYIGSSIDAISPLLKKTRELFKNNEIGSLINRFKTGERGISDFDTYSQSHGLSRGRNLLKKNNASDVDGGYDNPYCRVWTAHHQYGFLHRRIRPFYDDIEQIIDIQAKYDKSERPNGTSHYSDNTVLMKNGFVRISPMHDGGNRVLGSGNGDKQKYMFSIENLAWKDTYKSLSEEQIGPNKGRIMWFPPYNLKFNENVNVEWASNKFIGRGEQIYTYTNTERNGTLSFTLLIDHPSIINRWKWGKQGNDDTNEDENDLLRFFAGCDVLDMNSDDNTLNPGEQNTKQEANGLSENQYPGMKSEKIAYVVFFPNNFTADDISNVDSKLDKLREYETNVEEYFTDVDNFVLSEIIPEIDGGVNVSYLNLNENPSSSIDSLVKKTLFSKYGDDIDVRYLFNPTNGIDKIKDEITTDSYFGMKSEKGGGSSFISKITIKGNASSHGHADKNITLSKRRAEFMKSVMSKKCGLIESEIQKAAVENETITVQEISNENGEKTRINSREAKIARSAFILFEISQKNDTTPRNSVENGNGYVEGQSLNNSTYSKPTESNIITTRTVVIEPSDKFRYDNEYLYFSTIKETDPIVFEKIVKKVRYFDPSFHSITPEGFNSRLTFLHQCTRQGPTHSVSSGQFGSGSNSYHKYAGNLAFGRAPYCILRIGDFFNTKICITSVSIDYDNGGGVQWDLNPEGAGVQPMFANVNISFNFIGGQDITGPIERLQNAVTENYYANASIYSNRADNGKTFYSAVRSSNITPQQQRNEISALEQQESVNGEVELNTVNNMPELTVAQPKGQELVKMFDDSALQAETQYRYTPWYEGNSLINQSRNGVNTEGNVFATYNRLRREQLKP